MGTSPAEGKYWQSKKLWVFLKFISRQGSIPWLRKFSVCLHRMHIPNHPSHGSPPASEMTDCPGLPGTKEGFQDTELSLLKSRQSNFVLGKPGQVGHSTQKSSCKIPPLHPPQYTNPMQSSNTWVTYTHFYYGLHHPDDCGSGLYEGTQ